MGSSLKTKWEVIHEVNYSIEQAKILFIEREVN